MGNPAPFRAYTGPLSVVMTERTLRLLLPLGLALLLCPTPTKATNYYISPTGNDANSGTSEAQAWQTLDRLAQVQYALQPGDKVLLKRGGIYRGTLPVSSSGTAGAQVLFGAYGNGAKPIVAGSDLPGNWVVHQGNIWRTQITGPVKQLYVDGQPQTLARFPNTGWLRMDQGTSTTLHDADLDQPDGYWVGATAVIRASNWNFDLGNITGFSGGTLSFPTIYDNPGNYQWGYFLRNKLSELDAPGEWYYDENTGTLYFQPPGNADPNSLMIEAAVRPAGATVAWNRSYVRIKDIVFKHQTFAGVDNGGANHITVTDCKFQDLYHGIRSSGSYNSYVNCEYSRTDGSAVLIIDDHTSFSGNTLENIAMRPGEGETTWGYFGIRTIGVGNSITGNRFNTVGYIGIVADKDALIENNVLHHCLALLNDGSGIAFDNADGMVIRNNLVLDVDGDLESSAPDFPNYLKISHGIYFGNTSIKNTIVEGNTVTNCASSGIHVDHTMASTGNIIRNNVLFNNGVQISISDYSSNLGPAAAPPYYLSSYNEAYYGNTLYCLNKDQYCMLQYTCRSTAPVDFGTFSNNLYHNPYNELSIRYHNTFSGEQRNYTLKEWQATRSEDAGSTASPLHLNDVAVTAELTSEQVQNGNFNNNVNGWGGWPTNAQVTHDGGHLDNGALKAFLPNANIYPEFSLRSPVSIPVQQGLWYKLSFSLLSNEEGQLNAALKGQGQLTGLETIGKRDYPFGTDRRDIEFIFQASATDQAMVQFTNTVQNPMYWLDNVSVKQVQVQALDPADKHKLVYNEQPSDEWFALDGCWADLEGNLFSGQIQLAPYSSIVLVHQDDELCDIATTVPNMPSSASPVVFPNPVDAGGQLQIATTVTGIAILIAPDGKRWTLPEAVNGTTLTIPQGTRPGLYILELTDNAGARQAVKVMVN